MESIKRVVIHEAVVAELIKYIQEKGLRNGDRLPSERELTTLLNVSRNSVREALKILETNSTVIIQHGKGVFVNSVESIFFSDYDTTSSIEESLIQLKYIAQARIMVESFCASEVSSIITSEQIDSLYEYEDYENSSITKQETDNTKDFFPGIRLELMITDIYNNPYIKEYHRKIGESWKRYLGAIDSIPYPSTIRHKDHLDIINAIKNKSKIEKTISRHINRSLDAIDSLISQYSTGNSK